MLLVAHHTRAAQKAHPGPTPPSVVRSITMTSLRIGTRISGPVGRPQQLRAAVRPPTAGRRVRVAAIEQPLDSAYSEPESSALSELSSGDAAVDEGVQLQQLDEAQEGLLKWMLFLDGEDQAADLEADLDADEVADRPDDEFAAILDEVEGLLEEGEGSFKPGDKVFGTVYEVDEDGAYVEIGSKTAGFVPLVECSLGRLKSVRGARGLGSPPLRWGGARSARARARAASPRRCSRRSRPATPGSRRRDPLRRKLSLPVMVHAPAHACCCCAGVRPAAAAAGCRASALAVRSPVRMPCACGAQPPQPLLPCDTPRRARPACLPGPSLWRCCAPA